MQLRLTKIFTWWEAAIVLSFFIFLTRLYCYHFISLLLAFLLSGVNPLSGNIQSMMYCFPYRLIMLSCGSSKRNKIQQMHRYNILVGLYVSCSFTFLVLFCLNLGELSRWCWCSTLFFLKFCFPFFFFSQPGCFSDELMLHCLDKGQIIVLIKMVSESWVSDVFCFVIFCLEGKPFSSALWRGSEVLNSTNLEL